MPHWDAIVLGLGGIGSAAAYHLAKQGLSVLGLDRYQPPHRQGSSHGETRIIRQAYFEHPNYVPLLVRAYELWHELEQLTDSHLFHRTGIVHFGPVDSHVLRGVLGSAQQHDLVVQAMPAHEATKNWPNFSAPENWNAVFEENAGYLRVESCVRSHLHLAQRHGATLRYHTPIHHWCIHDDLIQVVTESGTHYSECGVLAYGPWSHNVFSQWGVKLRVLRKHQYWFESKEARLEQSAGFPCYFFDTPDGYFYGFPKRDIHGMKVARHSGGESVAGPSDQLLGVDPDDLQKVNSFTQRHVLGIATQPIRHESCYYTMTSDENFIVDLHPLHGRLAVVGGLSGHGFKFASVLGESAAQLALGQTPKCNLDFLCMKRLLA